MIFKRCLLIWISLAMAAGLKSLYAQNIYPNIDFEAGNLSGWTAFSGNCCPISTPAAGPQSFQHTVTGGAGTDPYSLGLLPMVAPGGQHSLRLGNDSAHSQAERISYSLTVNHQAPLLVYRYAVVFEYPANHPPSKQPRFEVTVKDSVGQLIECGYYSVFSADNLVGFYSNGNYRIKPWTDVAVDLSDYLGRQVTVDFATGDCGMGGHFGYAYIDGYATDLSVAVSPCNPDGSITLTAPPGFMYAWSTGQDSQAITLSHYNGMQSVSVELTSFAGCSKTIVVTLPPWVPQVSFDWQAGCDLNLAFYGHAAGTTPVTGWFWDFGDGQQSNTANPEHSYAVPGEYKIMLTAEAGGCRSSYTHLVNVEKAVQAAFEWPATPLCAGSRVLFTDRSKALRGIIQSRYWEFGDFSQSTAADPLHVYIHAGNYTVALVVTTQEGCSATAEKTVEVFHEDSCLAGGGIVWVPKAFSPNGDGINDYFEAMSDEAEVIGLEVYDRWGRTIYASSGPEPRWNGTTRNHRPAPDGVYGYKVIARLQERSIRQITGYVLLLH